MQVNVVEAQVDYNMVVADDRSKFREEGMSYLGSVGPYAVYKITGASPRLVGPYVKAPAGFGYAMACGAGTISSSEPASRKTGTLTSSGQTVRPSATNVPFAIRFSR